MSKLPYDEKLNIEYLSRLFDDTSNCYKFFWFQAILHKLKEDRTKFTYEELINEMIADAWYMVTEYHLRLGPIGVTDNLEEAVKYIGLTMHFPASEKREVIISYLENSEDKRLSAYKKELIKNVPYRIQSPFLDEIRRSLYCDGLSESDFGERLRNVIYPVYNAAMNNGFKQWIYEEAI